MSERFANEEIYFGEEIYTSRVAGFRTFDGNFSAHFKPRYGKNRTKEQTKENVEEGRVSRF